MNLKNRINFYLLVFILNVMFVRMAACETLHEILSAHGLFSKYLPHLNQAITSYAVLNSSDQFLIGYYLDDGSGLLREPLYFDRFDRRQERWYSVVITKEDVNSSDGGEMCLGSVLRIESSEKSFFIDTHINPSAGCLLILSKDLRLEKILYGWYLGRFAEESIIYHRSQPHFVAVHAAQIALYDRISHRDTTLYPHHPYQSIHLAHIGKLREFFESHPNWCRQSNQPCDPEWFDNGLIGSVATNEQTQSIAFLIAFDQELSSNTDGPAAEPLKVVYIYRHVNDENRMEYKEMLFSEVESLRGNISLGNLLDSEHLGKIFGEE